MNKKTQAAIEYWNNYAWAIFTVIIVISALVFFGILDPRRFLPGHINFGMGITVHDYSMSYFELTDYSVGDFKFIIRNNLGKRMENVIITIDECEGGMGESSDKTEFRDNEVKLIELVCENVSAAIGSVNKYNLELSYTTRHKITVLEHTKKAEMIVDSSKMNLFPDNNNGRKAWAMHNRASGLNDANRFFPCIGVEGCISDNDESIQIFGGYIDSKNGKVWQESEALARHEWSIRDLTNNRWDTVAPVWNQDNEIYEMSSDETVDLAFRNDDIGNAFHYCENLVMHDHDDWKLPMQNDFYGLLDCGQCLPPAGVYRPSSDIDRFYWTDTIAGDAGNSKCVEMIDEASENINANCNRDGSYIVRCIRDNE